MEEKTNNTQIVLVEFIDGTSKSIEAFKDPRYGFYGYIESKEIFYVCKALPFHYKAYFPREFVKAISILED